MIFVAIYLRLSRDDIGEFGESVSISNQRNLTTAYLAQLTDLGRYQIKEYCDDGYSGTTTNRPGFQQMMADVRRGIIKCIIVKDFSRFSRDYIEVGKYISQIFPYMGVRFISINDHYDSTKQGNGVLPLELQFKTLANDLYCKDYSLKSKSSINARLEKGEYVYDKVPMGYRLIKEEGNRIVIDEEEAPIVRRIIDLALDGKKKSEIAKILHKENVPTCSEIRKLKKRNPEHKALWTSKYIAKILNNPFYVGHMVIGKTQRKIVGSSKNSYVSPKEWKILYDHHPALMTEEEFKTVSSKESTRDYSSMQKKRHPLVGKVYCGGCGYAARYHVDHKNPEYTFFLCGHAAVYGYENCCHRFDSKLLEEIILFELKKELEARVDLVTMQREHRKVLQQSLSRTEEEQRQLADEYANQEALFGKLFNQYANGAVGKAEYLRLKNEYYLLTLKLYAGIIF